MSKGEKGMNNQSTECKGGNSYRYDRDMKNKWFYEQVHANKFENLCDR